MSVTPGVVIEVFCSTSSAQWGTLQSMYLARAFAESSISSNTSSRLLSTRHRLPFMIGIWSKICKPCRAAFNASCTGAIQTSLGPEKDPFGSRCLHQLRQQCHAELQPEARSLAYQRTCRGCPGLGRGSLSSTCTRLSHFPSAFETDQNSAMTQAAPYFLIDQTA